MSEDETDELPFARRIHPASSPTTEWERGQRQHAGCSDQEILGHTTQQQKSRPTESSQGREDLAFKRHSRRDDKSTKDPVLNHSQGIINRCRVTLRVSSHLPSLILDQTDPPVRALHYRPAA